ncbi:AI-2E family transporter [Palleronia sp. KMU-117]|uniref:AI-2E family transporter n=1 Tax=Palleronia sp. KMU-117 TaxID=3434108 RepID=UPI003D74828F
MTLPPQPLVSVALGVLATLAVLGLLHVGSSVFAPFAFALLLLALTAPIMAALEVRLGRVPAFIVTLVVTIVVVFLFASLALWAGRGIAGWITANIDRLAAAYRALDDALSDLNLRFDALLPDRFEARWILGPLTTTLSRLQSFGGFAILVLTFFALGLLEIGPMTRRLARIEARQPTLRLRAIVREIAGKIRFNLGLWAVVGLADATLCYLLFRLIGLDQPFAWAILIYVLNFIPFLGPLIVAVLLTAFAAAQFGNLGMVLLATGGTSLVNFVMGSYVQPLIAGRAIAISPILLLFSVLFWALIWGLAGAFLGVSMTIAILTICRATPALRWIADLFMDVGQPETGLRSDPAARDG